MSFDGGSAVATVTVNRRIRGKRPDSDIAPWPADGYDGILIHLTRRQQVARAKGTIAMSPEFYAIIATGIALAGLILNNQRAMAKSITELRRDLNASPSA